VSFLIRLSICIPTYNFGQYIGETLDSVISQADESVEIIIVDGASTDNTEAVVREYMPRFSGLRYHRNETNGGLDLDLAKTVELATGKYCWLLSSDDVLQVGALKRMLAEIEGGDSIYLCNRTEADLNMKPLYDRFWLSKRIQDKVFTFTNPEEWINYLGEARSLAGVFAYMSAIVFRRDDWFASGYDSRLLGSNYAHVFPLLQILKNGGTLKYLRNPLISCRTGNDSFLGEGIVKRYLIDINGYRSLAEYVFDDSHAVKRAFLGVLKREHPIYMWFRVRGRIKDLDHWVSIERVLLEIGYNKWVIRLIGWLGKSTIFVKSVRFCNRLVRRLQKKEIGRLG